MPLHRQNMIHQPSLFLATHGANLHLTQLRCGLANYQHVCALSNVHASSPRQGEWSKALPLTAAHLPTLPVLAGGLCRIFWFPSPSKIGWSRVSHNMSKDDDKRSSKKRVFTQTTGYFQTIYPFIINIYL